MTAIRLGVALIVSAAASLAQAQALGDWPAKTVTVVVPSSTGGGTDTYGRLLAQALTEQLKQSFVVDNKPGTDRRRWLHDAGGVELVAGHQPGAVQEFAVRRGARLCAGARFTHVLCKGVGPAYADLLRGRLQFMLTDLASVRQHIDAGKLLALAVTDKTRLLPNVPTLAEAGVPGIKAFTAFSVLVPAKVPPAIVKRIADEIAKTMKSPSWAAKLEQQALLPVFDTPEQFAASLKDEQQSWGNFIRQHNIQPD